MPTERKKKISDRKEYAWGLYAEKWMYYPDFAPPSGRYRVTVLAAGRPIVKIDIFDNPSKKWLDNGDAVIAWRPVGKPAKPRKRKPTPPTA